MIKKQKGFSLIELLIVVAIILIIAAIAIPNLLRSRMAANEASAVGSLRSINTADATFLSVYGHSFAPTLLALGGPTSGAPTCLIANLVDPTLGQDPATKSGYTIAYAPGTADKGDASCASVVTYGVSATPVTFQQTGTRGFFTDQTGVIRADPSGTATVASNPL